jgi:CRP/FNR family cyclic AMP-dependent transcriptional regulator
LIQVAGKNQVFKEGDILFQQGDPADCMYLVRNGALDVYIAKDDGNLTLATLDTGAIVGEMAFFDNKPRSASVRAAQTTEVTKITRADFDKLLTQVPKWMVTMMQSLSGRLRSTNERLQKLEEAQLTAAGGPILPNQRFPFQILLKTLRTINLSILKDGEREGREHTVPLDNLRELWAELVAEEPEILNNILKKLQAFGMISMKKNSLKQDVLAMTNRGLFLQLSEFVSKLGPKLKPSAPFLSTDAVELFKYLVETTVASGYESLNVNIAELMARYKSEGTDTSRWGSAVAELVKKLDLKVSKNGQSILVKIIAKEHKPARQHIEHLAQFQESKLI